MMFNPAGVLLCKRSITVIPGFLEGNVLKELIVRPCGRVKEGPNRPKP